MDDQTQAPAARHPGAPRFFLCTTTKLWVFAKKKEKNVITPTIVYKINVTRSWDLQNEGRVYNRGGKCSGSGPPSGELAEKGIFSFQKGELHSGYRS